MQVKLSIRRLLGVIVLLAFLSLFSSIFVMVTYENPQKMNYLLRDGKIPNSFQRRDHYIASQVVQTNLQSLSKDRSFASRILHESKMNGSTSHSMKTVNESELIVAKESTGNIITESTVLSKDTADVGYLHQTDPNTQFSNAATTSSTIHHRPKQHSHSVNKLHMDDKKNSDNNLPRTNVNLSADTKAGIHKGNVLNGHRALSSNNVNKRPRLHDGRQNTAVRECKATDKSCISLIDPIHFRKYYKSCERTSFLKTGIPPEEINSSCRFMDARGRDRIPVALVSVPGSGNTWVRGLLERATGICTGSIYCDFGLRSKGFIGEYVSNGNVLVVKTHTSDHQWKDLPVEKRNRQDALYGSAILLIRNPFDAFVSERHRIRTLDLIRGKKIGDQSHINEVGMDEFGINTAWNNYIRDIGTRWQKTIEKWFLSITKNLSSDAAERRIMILRYEDVKKNNLIQIERVLRFLNFSYNKDEVNFRLQNDYTTFHRSHRAENDEHYTVKQKQYVNELILATIRKLKEIGAEHLFNLEDYLTEIV